ncbi:MAG TPA: hypothetical protein G4N98_09935 [Thermoflexia bacterium]|nr:hypothetical protein [Anaerolineae bacterium]HEY90028.1 hypothetical protein [Thermoflexia bacterium]
MLKEKLERPFLIGAGLLSITHDKAKQLAEDLAEQGKVTRGEVNELADELVTRGAEERQAISKLVKDEVKSALQGIRLATKRDMTKLQAEIADLQAQLAALSMSQKSEDVS